MSLEDDIKILSSVSFFEGLNADQLRLLAFGSEAKFLYAGSELFLEGSPADCGYVVVSGLIDLTLTREDGSHIMASIDRGGMVGELSLISETLRVTNAIARRDSRLLSIPRVLFLRMLEKYPETAYDLYQSISRSVRTTVMQLDRIQHTLSMQEQTGDQ